MTVHHIGRYAARAVSGLLVAASLVAVFGLMQGTKYLSVQSGSMVPAFSKGDLVVVTDVPARQLAVGDVITFINPENKKQTITHRLQSFETRGGQPTGRVVTKGDANLAADRSIPTNAIIGKVSFAIPYLGFAFDFVRQPIGLLLLIYVPALTIVVSEVRKLAKYYKEQEPYVAAGHDPNQHGLPAAHIAAKASAAAIIAVTSVAAPVTHAALMSSATLSNSSLSTLAAANYPLLSKVQFSQSSGTPGGSSNVNVDVVNNNPQTATTGSTNGNNASSGNATNNSNTTIAVNVGGGANSGSNQRIDIYNPTNTPIAISNWKLTDNTTTHTIPNNTVVAPGRTYSFAWPAAKSLNPTGDRMQLRNISNVLIDSLSWGSDTSQFNPAIITNGSSKSLVRDDLRYDSGKASDWSAQ